MAGDARIGTLIAGYRIESLIGRGGMSVVYLAHHEGLERKAALKLLAPELAENEGFRQRFVRESRVAAGLDHPNVIPVYDAGEADGLLFIAMRYVRGSDLRTLLAEHGPLDPADVVRVMDQLGAALDAAHAEGLVHRDVKPANVLLSPPTPPAKVGHLYLADFGLTKKSLSGSGLTRSGQFVGTIDYVAPEQIRSEPVDERTDVYSMGAVLFECLTGKPPFARDTEVGVIFAHVNDPPPVATAMRDELPPAIDSVVARALAKSPEDRYATAGALAAAAHDALRPALAADSRTITAPAPAPRRRRALIAGGLVALAVVVAIVAAVVAGSGGSPGTTPSPSNGVSVSSTPTNSQFLVDFHGVVRVDPKTGARLLAAPQPFGRGSRGPASSTTRAVLAGEGALWVDGDRPPTVLKLDPASGRREGETELPVIGSGRLGAHQIFTAGESSVWVLQGAGGTEPTVLRRIQPATNQIIAQIPIGIGGNGLAFGREGLWVLQSQGTLSEIDIERRRIGRTIDIGAQAGGLAIGGGFLWVTSNITGTLYRVDPISEGIRAIDLAGGADAIAADDDGVWVLDRTSGTVVRVDPGSGDIGDPIRVGEQSSSITVGASAAWVPDTGDGNVYRIDAQSLERTVIPVARDPGPTWVAVGEGGVWVSVG